MVVQLDEVRNRSLRYEAKRSRHSQASACRCSCGSPQSSSMRASAVGVLTRRAVPRRMQHANETALIRHRWMEAKGGSRACVVRPYPPSCIALFRSRSQVRFARTGGVFKNAEHVHTGGSTGAAHAVHAHTPVAPFPIQVSPNPNPTSIPLSSGISHASVAPHTCFRRPRPVPRRAEVRKWSRRGHGKRSHTALCR